jgi:tRNA pseudouridine38-40 synthase
MPRYAARVEYDGRPFYGWQEQENGLLTVQKVVEEAFRQLFKKHIPVHASGRTDKGVHATGQIIHFDLDHTMDSLRLRSAINHYTQPYPVVLSIIALVPDTFNARFDAIERGYRYKILNRRARLTFQEGYTWHVPVPLDLSLMEKAAQDFLGQHDFTTFRSVDCQSRNPIRTINEIYFEQFRDEIHFVVRARSFLQHQIRSMIGTLERIGLEKLPPDYIKSALLRKDRKACGRVAPPTGLYLEMVRFPQDVFGEN